MMGPVRAWFVLSNLVVQLFLGALLFRDVFGMPGAPNGAVILLIMALVNIAALVALGMPATDQHRRFEFYWRLGGMVVVAAVAVHTWIDPAAGHDVATALVGGLATATYLFGPALVRKWRKACHADR